MTQQKIFKQERNIASIQGLNGVRALSCLAVMAHHYFQYLNTAELPATLKKWQQFFMLGNFGVSAFFVLSGFLLSLPFWSSFLNGRDYPKIKSYLVKRMARIAPGYYVSLSISVLVSALLFDFDFNGDTVLRYGTAVMFINGWHYLTMFPANSNAPLWSIGFEVVCYVLMPLGMLLMFSVLRRRSFIAGVFFWMGLLVLFLVLHSLIIDHIQIPEDGRGWQYGVLGGAKEWMPFYNPVGLFNHFILGVLACGFYNWLKSEKKLSELTYDLIGISTVLFLVFYLWSIKSDTSVTAGFLKVQYAFPVFPLLIAILLSTLPFTTYLARIFDNPVFHFIALISFGLYIWHYLIMELIHFWVAPDFIIFGVQSITRWSGLIGLTSIISIFVASLSYYFLERPALLWAKRRWISS